MSYMFSDCSSLTSLPNISKWNTSNVTNINSMFSYCSSLTSLPNISKWNTSKIYNLNENNNIFQGCNKLNHIPFKFILKTIKDI